MRNEKVTFKPNILKFSLSVFFLLHFLLCFGQIQSRLYPLYFTQYAQNFTLYNPAFLQKNSIHSGYQYYPSIGNDIRTVYLHGHYSIKKKENDFSTPSQWIGGIITNDKEGNFLSNSKIHGLFTQRIPLTKKWNLNAGLSLGVFNFLIKNNQAIGGSSYWIFDGNIGLSLYQKENKTIIGFSLNHIFQNTFDAFFSEIQLVRTGQLILGKKITINHNIMLNNMIWIQHNLTKGHYHYQGSLTLYKNIIIGGGIYYQQSFHILVGLTNLRLIGKKNDITLSYEPSISNTFQSIFAVNLKIF